MKTEQITEKIKSIIEREGKLNLSQSDLNSSFQNGLGLDSLTRIKVVVEIEKTFDVEIEEAAATKIDTVIQLGNYIEEQMKNNQVKA
jgi:acyl carrier protein